MKKSREKMQWAIIPLSVGITFCSVAALAQHTHDPGTPAATEHHSMSMADRPVQTAFVAGMNVSLDAMNMGMHVHMRSMKGNPVPEPYDAKQSHAIMVMIHSVASKKAVKDAEVTITITSLSGKKTAARAPWYGDHYGATFTPSEAGVVQVHVEVEGQKDKSEVNFQLRQ